MLTPFMLLPLLSRVAGQDGWVSIGVGQTLGAVAGTFVLFGWFVVGPARFHELTTRRERRALYVESLQSRLLVAAIAFPAVGVATALLVEPRWTIEAVLMSWATAAVGLSPSWYCIALGRPALLMRYDALPKLAATGLSAVTLLISDAVWVYPTLLIVGTLGSTVTFTCIQARSRNGLTASFPVIAKGLRSQLPVVMSNLVGTTYTSSPLPLASSLGSVVDAASFASAERLYRLSKFSIVALGNSFQSWVLEKNASSQYRRHGVALIAHLVLGLMGGSLIAAVGPWFTALLFGSDVGATFPSCLGFGVAFLFLSCSSPLTRNILIPAGRSAAALRATVSGAIVGIPSMLVLFQVNGVAGIGLGLACSEALVFFMLLNPALRQLGTLRP